MLLNQQSAIKTSKVYSKYSAAKLRFGDIKKSYNFLKVVQNRAKPLLLKRYIYNYEPTRTNRYSCTGFTSDCRN